MDLIAFFEDAYKRASNRLRLLARVRDQLTSEIAFKIYEMMNVLILTYSGNVNYCLQIHNWKD